MLSVRLKITAESCLMDNLWMRISCLRNQDKEKDRQWGECAFEGEVCEQCECHTFTASEQKKKKSFIGL